MKIVICLDNSEHTEKVLQAAKLLLSTRIPPAEIIIVHIIDTRILATGIGNEQIVMEQLQDESRWINELARQYLGETVRYIEEEGVPSVKIDEVLNGIDYDLLVSGTKGRSLAGSILAGSFAEHVLHNSSKPFMIVPC